MCVQGHAWGGAGVGVASVLGVGREGELGARVCWRPGKWVEEHGRQVHAPLSGRTAAATPSTLHP